MLYMIFLKSDFWYCISKILRVYRVKLSTYLLSHHYLFLKFASSRRSEGYLIETVHHSYAPSFLLIAYWNNIILILVPTISLDLWPYHTMSFSTSQPHEISTLQYSSRPIEVMLIPHWFYRLLENHHLRWSIWTAGSFFNVMSVCFSLVLLRSSPRSSAEF